jgi:hypothetical protein
MSSECVCSFTGGVKPECHGITVTGGPGVCQRNVSSLGGDLGIEYAGVRQSLCGAETRAQVGPSACDGEHPARSLKELGEMSAVPQSSYRVSLDATDCVDVIDGGP